ncbi:MAG: hypothetical protein JNK87_20240 [Bryobacterales bacterium]|nr:hypothetical protein [Bryobacterales bacterium]
MTLHPNPPETLEFHDEESLDQALAQCPNVPAAFLIWPSEGAPYLAKTALLKRRLDRLLGRRSQPSRLLHLRALARRVEYWPYASRLEASLLLYELARTHFPDTYTRVLKLRQPPFVKLLLGNEYPRTQVTTRLSGSEALHYGPFSSRSAAEAFEAGFLDLFQIRRCQEDLEVSPEHPGCLYGEMGKCLRPCQMVVTAEGYRSEVARVEAFLRTGGHSLLESIQTARDRLSEEMEFEEAARMHKRLEKVTALVQSKGELACDIQNLGGVAILPALRLDAVMLWFLLDGYWRPGITLSLELEEGRPVPLDRKIRERLHQLPPARRVLLKERQEHLALLTAWFFSSWRDGEWVPIENSSSIPYRKVVNAVHRVVKRATAIP